MSSGELRPAQRMARQRRGDSMDASEAAGALLREISAQQAEEAAERQVDGALAAQIAEAAQTRAAPRPVRGGHPLVEFEPEDTDVEAPEDILFGPMATIRSSEERHLAAWELYTELRELRERGTNDTDLPARLLTLHSDNGNGWCQGCGRNDNGGYAVSIETCATRIEMDQ
jgi:hypothetical protein